MTTQAVQLEEPLFDSAWAALAFAFRYSTQQYSPTPMARLMRGSIGSGKGLVGLDGAAQAGIIRAEVDKLKSFERSAVIARFALADRERLEAMLMLVPPAAASLGTGVHNRRMVDALVQRFYGKKINLKDLAEIHGMHANTLTSRWQCVRRMLTETENRGMDQMEARLQQAGLVP